MTKTRNALVLVLLFASASARAAAAPDYDQTCDDVMALSDGIDQAGQNAWQKASQKLQYCRAAKDSKSAASSNGLLWKVWAGVAGVCTYACIASITGIGAMNQWVCTGSNIGAGLTDAVVTKDFMGGLTAIGTSLAGVMVNRVANGAPKAAAEATTKPGHGPTNWGACLSAATATMSVFTKKRSQSQATDAMNGNLASAATLGPIASVMGPTTASITTPANIQTNTTVNNNTQVTGGMGLTAAPKENDIKASCDGADKSGDTSMVVSCAMASDKNLPGFVGSTPFMQELKNATGESLGGFVAKASDPNQAITAASGLPADGGAKLSQLVAAAGKAVNAQGASEGEVYAGGGGMPATSGGQDDGVDPGIAAAVAKLMKGLKPGEEEKDPRNIKFSGKPGVPTWLRGPASEDDRNVSLFDRVTYRYYFVGRKLIYDEETTPGVK